jgi:peptidoglycan/LPS O-acetylase OafA/YrhL
MEVSVAKNQCIQQLRGLAILLVLFAHLSLPTTLLQMSGFPIVNPGYSGVWLFFVISGYVVVRSFQRSGWDCTRFAIRRVHRLYPSLIAFLGVSGLVVGLASLYPVGSLPRTLLAGAEWDFWVQGATVLAGIFINAIQGHTPLYVNGAIWSLSIEFQFYLSLWVLVFLAVWRGLGDAKIADNVRWLAMIVLGLVAGIRVAMLIGYSPKALFGPFIGGWLFSIVIWRFDFMACGVILALSQNKWMGIMASAAEIVSDLALCTCWPHFARDQSSSACRSDRRGFFGRVCRANLRSSVHISHCCRRRKTGECRRRAETVATAAAFFWRAKLHHLPPAFSMLRVAVAWSLADVSPGNGDAA